MTYTQAVERAVWCIPSRQTSHNGWSARGAQLPKSVNTRFPLGSTLQTDVCILYSYTSKKSCPGLPTAFGSYAGGCVRPLLVFDCPEVKFLISFSTSRIKFNPPPAGLNTTVKRGQARKPKQQDRSGFPADLGHSQKGVDGTVVTIQTPSVGQDKKPR